MMSSLLPNMAFAAEVSDGEYPSATCTVTEGCTLEDGHDGECVTAPTEDSTDGEGNDNVQDSSVPADTESEEETEYLAEPLAADGAYTVKVYATVSGMKFSDGEMKWRRKPRRTGSIQYTRCPLTQGRTHTLHKAMAPAQ